jgi:transposase InsO family protein
MKAMDLTVSSAMPMLKTMQYWLKLPGSRMSQWISGMTRASIPAASGPTREAAKADIFDYIERFYNRKRLHAMLGFLSPVAFKEQAMRA